MIEGDYEISGKVLVLPVVGKGKCRINLGNDTNNSCRLYYIQNNIPFSYVFYNSVFRNFKIYWPYSNETGSGQK